MIGLPKPRNRRPRESTIALINIVFLMLIFFLIAGSLAPPLDRAVSPIAAPMAPSTPPMDALAIRADGALSWRGEPVTVAAFAAERAADGSGTIRVYADRDHPAAALVDILAELGAAGAGKVVLLTDRGQ